MDAVNVIKGYNKVNRHHENLSLSPPPPPQKRIKATVIIFALVLLTLMIGLMFVALVHESNNEEPESEESPSLSSNAADSIKKVCSVTRYPDSCFTSLSSLNVSTTNPDPEIIMKLSLQVTINELSNISTLIKSLNERLPPQAALVDCMGQLEDALSRLNDSLSEMEVGSGEDKILTERKVNDIQTWVSAAMTDEDSCLDGLEEMGSTAVDEVKIKMKKSKELLSNSLAIIANMKTLLDKFGLTMH